MLSLLLKTLRNSFELYKVLVSRVALFAPAVILALFDYFVTRIFIACMLWYNKDIRNVRFLLENLRATHSGGMSLLFRGGPTTVSVKYQYISNKYCILSLISSILVYLSLSFYFGLLERDILVLAAIIRLFLNCRKNTDSYV